MPVWQYFKWWLILRLQNNKPCWHHYHQLRFHQKISVNMPLILHCTTNIISNTVNNILLKIVGRHNESSRRKICCKICIQQLSLCNAVNNLHKYILQLCATCLSFLHHRNKRNQLTRTRSACTSETPVSKFFIIW